MDADEDVAQTQGGLVMPERYDYSSYCLSQGVPMPPPWGASYQGPPGSGKPWIKTGHFTGAEMYINFAAGGDIYYASVPGGLCVIAAHNDMPGQPSLFDLICQNATTGKACFWESNRYPAPPPNAETSASSVTLVAPGDTGYVATPTTICTSCHAGANAFLTHYSLGGSKHPTDLNGTSGWMPANWFNPIVPASNWPLNPKPSKDVLADYPTSTCYSCHRPGGSGGQFPDLTTVRGGYCDVLRSAATTYTGTQGVMPPAGGQTPNDSFVKAALASCNGTTRPKYAGLTGDFNWMTPTVVRTPSWQYVMASTLKADGVTGGAKYIPRVNNEGWGSPTWLPANYFTTSNASGMYLKFGTTFSYVALSDSYGSVYEKSSGAPTMVDANSLEWPRASPAAAHVFDGTDCIAWIGDDGWITDSCWNPAAGSWSSTNLHAAKDFYGDPAQQTQATTSPMRYQRNSNAESIVYGCGPSWACELRFALVNGKYTYYEYVFKFPYPFRDGTRPVGFASTNGNGNWLFANTTGGLYALQDRTSNGTYGTPTYDTMRLGTGTAYQGSPRPYQRADGRVAVMLNYSLSTGARRILEYNRLTSWSSSSTTIWNYPGDVIGSEPTPFVTTEGLNAVVVQTLDRKLWELRQPAAGGAYVATQIPW
jgi:hypothetical protein